MSQEKRRFSRIPFQVNAEITIDQDVYPVPKINNLSIGGGFFPMTKGLPPGFALSGQDFSQWYQQ